MNSFIYFLFWKRRSPEILTVFLITLFFTPLALFSQTNTVTGITVLSPSDPIMDRGFLLINEKQYEAAILEFSKVSENYPRDLRIEESLFQIAECYRLLERNTDALNAYLFLEKKNPKTLYLSQIQIQIGLLYGKLEKYKEALPYLEKANANPSPTLRPLIHYALGLAYLRNQEPMKAIPLLKTVIESDQDQTLIPLAAWALADEFEKMKKTEDALPYWKKTLELTKDQKLKAQASARSGWTYLQLNQPQQARTLFEKTRECETQGDWRKIANTGLLQIDYQEQKHDAVIRLYQEERQSFLDARRSEIFFMVGFSHYQLKNFEQAVEVLGLFIKNFPNHPQITLAAYTHLIASIQLDPKNTATVTAAFIARYPQSEFINPVKLLRAQDYARRKKFIESIPMWDELQTVSDPKLPREEILFERARASYETKSWLKAAEAFGDFLQEFPKTDQSFTARLSKAISLQQGGKNSLDAWEDVKKNALVPSPPHQMAIEQIGLLTSKTNSQEKSRSTWLELIDRYPESPMIPLAYFQLGTFAVTRGEKAQAIKCFEEARKRDPTTWDFAATQQMVYLSYDLKLADETLKLLTEYESLCAKREKNEIIPAAIYYWLGEVHRDQKKYAQAANFFAAVNAHPQSGELLKPSWWNLAEAQRQAGFWKFAITSYEHYQKIDPENAKSNAFLLSLAEAHLGAKNWNDAQPLAEKVMLQDPEGKSAAHARFVVAECHEGRNNPLEAAKAYAALAVLYDDPEWTPRAMYHASLSFSKAGDSASSKGWLAKLDQKYPQYRK